MRRTDKEKGDRRIYLYNPGTDFFSIAQTTQQKLAYIQGKFPEVATTNDYYMSLSYTIRDHLLARWRKAAQTYLKTTARTVCYLSAEFLIGPQLKNNVINLGISEGVNEAVEDLGFDLDSLCDQEPEPGLGNGGLGRLAACYMDSLATLNIPAIGYGIRYEFGIFEQDIRNGWQVECTDKWLRYGNPWEIPRPEISFDIQFGGYTENVADEDGHFYVRWVPSHGVKSVAHDIPTIGYNSSAVNLLRLWKAEACESFDFQAFNMGDYYKAVEKKMVSENITKVLYPNDEPVAGRELRLQQQYFFTSSALQDMIRIYKQTNNNLESFHEKYVIQLNDTHPSIGIAELMRLFVDEHRMDWDKAWNITKQTFCYTNHTLMAEALEKWPLPLFAKLLPRHLEIIIEINRRFLEEVKINFPDNEELLRNLSIIDETGERYVRMTNLACIGSSTINGVSHLHTDLLKKQVLKDFNAIWPKKIINITNGITPRRFLLASNPELSQLITKNIGDTWIKDLDDLHKLESFAENKEFQKEWDEIKQKRKQKLADLVFIQQGITINVDSIFDIQAKRFHEYKRQHLNILHVITLYNRLRRDPNIDFVPRTVFFAGKAAPGYFMAKLIIKLINSVANVVNNDPVVQDRLKVVFLPNFNVKKAENVYPAADLSEQVSTAGKEASGTGNMKFALNGALTIGTFDGANIEILEEVGLENFFLFGLRADEVVNMKNQGYDPTSYVNTDSELREALELIKSGYFSDNDAELFRPLINNLLYHDEYMLCADYRSYIECQDKVSQTYRQKEVWTKMAILNVARMGKFSSDRAINQYAKNIWKVEPIVIE
jgi:starch phosphorylase